MRLQRHLLVELVTSFVLIAFIVTAIFFAAMMLQFLHAYSQLSLLSVLKAAPYIVPLSFPVALPVSFLIACLLTFGRFADENEFLAMQMGGIHPWHAAAPAFVLGAVLTLATVELNTEVIPFATLAKKVIARVEIRELLRAVDDPDRDELRVGDMRMSWHGRDERGLIDVRLSCPLDRTTSDGTVVQGKQDLHAARGRVDVDKLDPDLLVFDLDDVESERKEGGGVTYLTEGNLKVALSLEELAGAPPDRKSKGLDEMDAAQLHYRIRRLRESGMAAATRDNLDYLRRLETEYWKRIALGLAPIVFALVGAALGLAGGRGNRMAAFLTAVVVALPIYYPLLLWGQSISRAGTLPAPLATNLANIVLVAAGLWKLGRVFR